MMSSSIPFERYDEEFLSLTEQVTSKLRSLDPKTSGGAPPPSSAEADVKMAHNLLLQADDLLKQMGLEARGVDDASVKRDLLGKVSVCRHSAPALYFGKQISQRVLSLEQRCKRTDMESAVALVLDIL